ncbi:hypothetical protein ASG22_08295 [Chryseobacterium sp. Leaf405]|uniref:hypothetical protein n=1 Tax=Chryseobacterium sp. Leaf405 TaxID=1736367 RepID=UPI0006F2FF2B|nr:hypothetical protein [Chryseobacterium sp. Leaf405]KQT24014.1 hypothetical protein ASG22_08295 [Chryseobacterium sp. Leaf405]
MAEELYFIKTNPIVAKINLYNKLCREEETVMNFLNDDKKTSLEIIKNKVKDSINMLSQDEFFNIVKWITDPCKEDYNEVETQLFINGMDLFYEIPSKTPVRSFHSILSDYECLIEKDFSILMSSDDFNNFLIFGIFSSGLLSTFLDQYYYESPDTNDDLLLLTKILKPAHERLFELAQTEFDSTLQTLEEDIIGLKKVVAFNRENLHESSATYPSEFKPFLQNEKEILSKAFSYNYFMELYEHTKFYKGSIIRLHSY